MHTAQRVEAVGQAHSLMHYVSSHAYLRVFTILWPVADLDSKLVQKIFKHTTLYSASILFSMVSALIRGKADGNLQGSYDGSIPYRAEPRRAVTSEKVMGKLL